VWPAPDPEASGKRTFSRYVIRYESEERRQQLMVRRLVLALAVVAVMTGALAVGPSTTVGGVQ
jgi:hypothetical protein